MSSPTLMFASFGLRSWWGAVSLLTCPATGLLEPVHPTHVSTSLSAQGRVVV